MQTLSSWQMKCMKKWQSRMRGNECRATVVTSLVRLTLITLLNEGMRCNHLAKGRENNQCKGLELGACLVSSRTSKDTTGATEGQLKKTNHRSDLTFERLHWPLCENWHCSKERVEQRETNYEIMTIIWEGNEVAVREIRYQNLDIFRT